MPELPEVETTRLGLLPSLEGACLTEVQVRRADLRFPFPEGFSQRLKGRRVNKILRRGKYILAYLDNALVLVMHLGMSGRFRVRRLPKGGKASPLGKHDHVVFITDRGEEIIFSDHRRFGLMDLLAADTLDSHRLFAGMGAEPLSPAFNARYLTRMLEGSRSPIKTRLLDQSVVAGLGNIYVCEALFRAGISPLRSCASVLAQKDSGHKVAALTKAIKAVLRDALKAGGSSLRDYAHADGSLGSFQDRFSVYDRENEACPHCGPKTRIRRKVQSGRSTFYCGTCQK